MECVWMVCGCVWGVCVLICDGGEVSCVYIKKESLKSVKLIEQLKLGVLCFSLSYNRAEKKCNYSIAMHCCFSK